MNGWQLWFLTFHEIPPSTRSYAPPRQQSLILFSLGPMQRLLILVATCAVLSACSVSHSKVEQRSVELPKDHPDTSLATADEICRHLASGDLTTKVRERFPQLTDQQLNGIFFRPMSGTFSQTRKTTFILAGINYQEGTLSDAKAIADYIHSVVRDAVARRFGSANSAATP